MFEEKEITAEVVGSCFCSTSEDVVTAGSFPVRMELVLAYHHLNLKWMFLCCVWFSCFNLWGFFLYHLDSSLSLVLSSPLQVVEVLENIVWSWRENLAQAAAPRRARAATQGLSAVGLS